MSAGDLNTLLLLAIFVLLLVVAVKSDFVF